jgi:hypothetical protein
VTTRPDPPDPSPVLPTAEPPYISIVAVARNDDYGGNFLARVNAFVRNIVTLSEKYRLPCELILVEWNPPGDRPRLREALSWPDVRREFTRIRILEVPARVHQSLPNPAQRQVFEHIGKNAGLRRARGRYLLATNPDTLFSEELMRFLAARRLRRNRFYRIDRCDVRMPLPAGTVPDQLRYCRENIMRIFGYYWSHYDRPRYGRLWRWRQLRSLASYVLARLRRFPAVPLHCGAAGDFLLLHRDHWDALQGLPELETQGKVHHIDCLAVHQAQARGWKQVILKHPLRLYHQEHGRAGPDEPISPAVRDALERVRQTGRPFPTPVACITWGLGQEELPESCP